MKLSRLEIRNFRGIGNATLLFPDHVVLIGDNNSGKSTVLEAIDLVLGPDRLSRRSPIDEHDFYVGRYLGADAGSEDTSSDPLAADAADAGALPAVDGADSSDDDGEDEETPRIHVEATITGLSGEQTAHFRDYIEWWNTAEETFYVGPGVEGVDADAVVEALRVTFIGEYSADEDAFEGKTFFARSLEESDSPQPFTRRDKQYCGFLYLRGLRTGRRALSLEYGSLLDIILRLKEIRPQMWETTIKGLSAFDVASDPELGISGVLESINTALNKYVPKEWGVEPHLRL